MGEKPIFTTKAHIFQIDPDTKKNWVQTSKHAISVSFYYDSLRKSYRIISVEGSKAIINSTITPNMTFTKTSQKFGQWSDPKANTVYGLGFGTEADLNKFIEKFKEVKELIRQSVSPSIEVNGSDGESSTGNQSMDSHNAVLHQRTNSLSSLSNDGSGSLRERRNSFTGSSSNLAIAGQSPEIQMKYENDRLKLALAQSSSNAKKWEVELQTLKNNNARLTTALQDSTTNVEEWKKQLAAYKDESARLKKKVLEMEKRQNSPEHTAELQKVTDRLDLSQQQNKVKQEEIDRLNKRLSEMMTKEALTASLQAKVQNLDKENTSLSLKLREIERNFQESHSMKVRETSTLVQLQTQLGSRMTEMYELHEQILATLKGESNS